MDSLKSYIESLQGIPYKWWLEGPTGPDAPFYAANAPLPLLPIKEIRRNGLNCAGFMNLLRRHQGLEVPGVKEGLWNAGGTYVWFRYFKERDLLTPFEPTNLYPAGTLLLRDYTSVWDQGHLAITMGLNRIAHCYPDDPTPIANKLVQPGVQIEPLNLSMNWGFNGYYTHTVAPHDWLSLCDRTPSQTE